MRKLTLTLLMATAVAFTAYAGTEMASSKDMKQTVAPVPTCDFTWTGFYIGARAGYSWDAGRMAADTLPDPITFDVDSIRRDSDADGFVGGGELGYNWQFGKMFVIGAEADLSAATTDGDRSVSPLPLPGGGTVAGEYHLSHDVNWYGTVRGRVGIAPTCKLLLYGTGGLAYAHTEDTGDLSYLAFGRIPTSHTAGRDGTDAGYAVGGGLEYAISNHWTVKGEYLYINCGDHSSTGAEVGPNGAVPPFGVRYHWETQFHTATVGINYKF